MHVPYFPKYILYHRYVYKMHFWLLKKKKILVIIYVWFPENNKKYNAYIFFYSANFKFSEEEQKNWRNH